MYDKECQGPDYVDAKKLEKKKRTHHRRDPEPEPTTTPEAEQTQEKEPERNRIPGGSWDDAYLQ